MLKIPGRAACRSSSHGGLCSPRARAYVFSAGSRTMADAMGLPFSTVRSCEPSPLFLLLLLLFFILAPFAERLISLLILSRASQVHVYTYTLWHYPLRNFMRLSACPRIHYFYALNVYVFVFAINYGYACIYLILATFTDIYYDKQQYSR